MSRYWSEVARRLEPYVPGEQPRFPNLVKLNTNENPYGPSPRAIEALQRAANADLRLYPDPDSTRLRESIAAFHGVSADQVFVGNGSDEVLAHAFLALLKHAAPILFPDVTYSFYPVYCGLYGITYREVPLAADFSIRVEDYRPPNGGIIFPNPNAPTGRLLALADVEHIVAANPQAVVVVDEAYIDFGGESAMPLIHRHPNLLVVRTLSKSHALAGLRVGYAVGDAALIAALARVKDSFNSYPLDRLAQAGASAAIEDRDYFDAMRAKVIASRERLVAGLGALGFDVLPSAANFVFARHPAMPGGELAARLREQGIIVRHFRKPARIDPFVRITVGTDAQCDTLMGALGTLFARAAG